MVIAESTFSKVWINNRIKVAAVFLLSGLLSGLVSGWLSSTSRLRGFLFLKGDKFLIPTYKFWAVFALVFSIALVVAYFFSRALGWLTLSPSVARQLSALFVVVTSPVVLYFSTHANFLIAAIFYVVFLPLAMCIITGRMRLFALAVLQNIFVLIAALVVIYAVLSLINGLSSLYEYVQTGIAQSLFAAAFGSWLTWTPTRLFDRTA